MVVILPFSAVALIAFFIGVFFTRSLSVFVARLANHRSRRRFVKFVQPGVSDTAVSSGIAEAERAERSIYRVLRIQEDECEKASLRKLPLLGEKAPRCYEKSAYVLALLDAFSSCAWGCSEGDHILERLVGRSVSHARGALRLALMGFYDESLVLIRGVGEIANLLSLFEAKDGVFARWKTLDERRRRKEFSPVSVREALKSIGTPIRVTGEVYAALSSRNVHVSPHTSPQTYDMHGRPKAGAYYQDAGFVLCLNELAKSLTFVSYSAAKLSHLSQPLKRRLLMAGRDLILHTGSLGIENIDEMWAELVRKTSESSEKGCDGDTLED